MKSMLSGFLGSQVHHRRAERGVSITLPSLRQSNFGKLQFGFVLADFQISPTLKLYFWALFRPALHKMSQIKWCNVKINNPEKNISPENWVKSESKRIFLSYLTPRDCRLLISTKCSGMGCDNPDIRLTVCIGQFPTNCSVINDFGQGCQRTHGNWFRCWEGAVATETKQPL